MSDHEFDTIERCPHDKENPYAIISRDLIRDKNISPECRWLLIYLLSNDGKWVVKTKQLRNHLEGFMGRDKILSVIKEAIDAGYMKRDLFKINNLNRSRYYVSETPKFKKCFRRPENQDPESGDPENTDYIKNSNPKEEHLKEREEAQAPPHPLFKYKRVKMDQEKIDKLLVEFGNERVNEMMDRLDEYADINPKRFKQYACHATVIRKWIREDKEKGKAIKAGKPWDSKIDAATQGVGAKHRSEVEGDHRSWASSMESKVFHLIKQELIRPYSNGWEFRSKDGKKVDKIEFKEEFFIRFCEDLIKELTMEEANA
jgi:hypothetical protein